MQSLSLISNTVQDAQTLGQTPPGNTGLKCQTHSGSGTLECLKPVLEKGSKHSALKETEAAAQKGRGLKCQPHLEPIPEEGFTDSTLKPRLTAKIDWLQGTFRATNLAVIKSLVEYLGDCLDDIFTWKDGIGFFKGTFWANTIQSLRGIKIGWSAPGQGDNKSSKQYKILVSINGRALGAASFQGNLRLIAHLLEFYRFNPTRIDLAVDDFSKQLFTMQDLQEVVDKGNYSRAEVDDDHKSKKRLALEKGWTFTFGHPMSDKRVKAYNKAVESKGEIDSHRLEPKFTDDRAKAICAQLARHAEDVPAALEYFTAVVGGSIDFVDRSSGDRLSRQKRLDWWQKTVDLLGHCTVALPKITRSIEKSLAWMQSQVSTTVFMFKQLAGEDFPSLMDTIARLGEGKANDIHYSIIDDGLKSWDSLLEAITGKVYGMLNLEFEISHETQDWKLSEEIESLLPY